MKILPVFRSMTFLFLLLGQVQGFCNEELLFSVDIIRHGERNPLIEIPKAPHAWHGNLGELTYAGFQRERDLGSNLKIEYVDQSQLLPEQYRAGVLHIRSTDFSRTKESARALLEGLYPTNTRNGLEIPILFFEQSHEDLLLVQPSDTLFARIKMFFWKRNFWAEHTKKLQDDLSRWRAATGLKLDTINQMIQFADHLYIRQLDQIEIPGGIDPDSVNKIISLSEIAMTSKFEQDEVSGLAGRKLLKVVNDYFKQRIEGASDLRCVIYVAHDSTIMAALYALGAKVQYPAYGSRLNFSLYKKNARYQVRIHRDGRAIDIPSPQSNGLQTFWNK
jgi:hypothetical protein